MSNLAKRTISGIIFIGVMLLGLALNQYLFIVVFGVMMLLSHYEFYTMMHTLDYRPNKTASMLLGMAFFVICFLVASQRYDNTLFSILPLFIVLFFIIELYRDKKNTLIDTYTSLAAVVYIAVPFGLLNFIVFNSLGEFYSYIAIGIFLLIWTYDSFAFIGGISFGKHKLMERLSPKKTWEGVIVGAIFALALSYLISLKVEAYSFYAWAGIAMIIVFFGTLGDLFESRLKRSIGVKDSGKFLPGHGGLLDRFDTLLFVAPVVVAWLYIVEIVNI